MFSTASMLSMKSFIEVAMGIELVGGLEVLFEVAFFLCLRLYFSN